MVPHIISDSFIAVYQMNVISLPVRTFKVSINPSTTRFRPNMTNIYLFNFSINGFSYRSSIVFVNSECSQNILNQNIGHSENKQINYWDGNER